VIDTTTTPSRGTSEFNIQGFQILVSPDASRLYALSADNDVSGISLLDITGKTPRQAQNDIAFAGRANAFTVSPDGVNIYAAYRDADNGNGMVLIASPVSAG
jgi:hypothetical protein